MPAEGYVQVHVYTSDAQIPLEGAAVAMLDREGRLIAARLTNSSGQIQPVAIAVPDAADSRNPNFAGRPFTTIEIRVNHPDYEGILVQGTQVFAGVTTVQPFAMIPTPLYPDALDRVEYFDVPPQNL